MGTMYIKGALNVRNTALPGGEMELSKMSTSREKKGKNKGSRPKKRIELERA